MRYTAILLLLAILTPSLAQQSSDQPTNEKAQKTYKEAFSFLRERELPAALDSFKKADKQDGGHCIGCQKNMIKYGVEIRDWRIAEFAAEEMVAEAQGEKEVALAHYQLGKVLMHEGVDKHKEEVFTRAHEQFSQALAAVANFPDAVFADGRALSNLKQDDAAKAKFEDFLKICRADDPNRQRAVRYISRPELARARMAPAFAVTTLDGQHVSLDDLQGKVVLLDFWATWCGPCRQALPRIQSIAKHFQGQPLVIFSVSLDNDEMKWKEFITKNEMTWLHYRDGYFNGPIAKMFGVEAIPHTFTIDADGVLQDENVGDAAIEGKLKKLVAHARELQTSEKTGQ